MAHSEYIDKLSYKISGLNAEDALRSIAGEFAGEAVFSTSLSKEDQVITHLIFSLQLPVKVFTLDTGRLFPETYSVWRSTLERYGQPIHAYYPNETLLSAYVTQNGPNAFYESVELRKECCYVRKVEPLTRALKGQALWITGLRAAHSPNRSDMQALEWDASNQVIKYHPILHWSHEDVDAFIKKYNIPYNPLHDKGFVSIGCAPCTRAVRAGEDFRAGRWWWEEQGKKECGLHVHR